MIELKELKDLQSKFKQGLKKLELIKTCLGNLKSNTGLEIQVEALEDKEGILIFWFSGTRYYVKVRLTDRSIESFGMDYNLPIGWLDWGRFTPNGTREEPEQSNYYDDRGILCELEKEEFYCNFENCDEEKLRKGMLYKLQRLVGRTIAMNNTQAV